MAISQDIRKETLSFEDKNRDVLFGGNRMRLVAYEMNGAACPGWRRPT
jgi:hypothetical protein